MLEVVRKISTDRELVVQDRSLYSSNPELISLSLTAEDMGIDWENCHLRILPSYFKKPHEMHRI